MGVIYRRVKRAGVASVLLCLLAAAAGTGEWKPARLDQQPEMSGTTWYRCFIRVPADMTSKTPGDLWSDSVTLSLAGVNGRFRVYLNGRQIAEGAAVADDGPRRRVKVPKGVLEPKVFNVLAVRVEGAMRRPPILAGYFDELVLNGMWEVRAGD